MTKISEVEKRFLVAKNKGGRESKKEIHVAVKG
jgi:hypothetical protein